MNEQNPSSNKQSLPGSKKKSLIIVGAVIAFILVGLGWFFGWGSGKNGGETSSVKPTPIASQLVLSESEKPEIELEINTDRSGGEIIVSKIDSRFSEMEYELIYLAEIDDQEIERGVAGGPLTVPDSRSVSESFIFGTESCTTGVCKRRTDKNVSGGTLIIRLMDSENRIWSTEKEFSIEKVSSGYEVIWSE